MAYLEYGKPRELLDRQPPNDVEAENCLIGSILIDRTKLAEVRQVMPSAKSFYRPAAGAVYEEMLKMSDEGQPIDAVLLRARLRKAGRCPHLVEDADLAEMARAVPTATNAVQYARIVREKALLRWSIWIACELLKRAFAADAAPAEVSHWLEGEAEILARSVDL